MMKDFYWRASFFSNLSPFKKLTFSMMGGVLPLVVFFPFSLLILPLFWFPLLYPFKFELKSEGPYSVFSKLIPIKTITKVEIAENKFQIHVGERTYKWPVKRSAIKQIKEYFLAHKVSLN